MRAIASQGYSPSQFFFQRRSLRLHRRRHLHPPLTPTTSAQLPLGDLSGWIIAGLMGVIVFLLAIIIVQNGKPWICEDVTQKAPSQPSTSQVKLLRSTNLILAKANHDLLNYPQLNAKVYHSGCNLSERVSRVVDRGN